MNKFIILLPALMLLHGCGDKDQPIGGSGLLEADEILVAAETSGRVIVINFDEGATLDKYDTLLIIDPSRLELEHKAARAGLAVAKARRTTAGVAVDQSRHTMQYLSGELDRITALKKSGTATGKQFDKINYEKQQAVSAYQAAQANVATIDAELEKIMAEISRIERALLDCYPVSPGDGTVIEKYIEQGELLSPGKPIARLAKLDTLWVKVYLPSGEFASVKIGDQATIDTEAGQTSYPGTVIWTSAEAEFTPKNVQTKQSRADLVYAVKVRLENSDGNLKIGMPVFVTLEK